ncbi:MAG: DMT family transporter [Bacillota bacterium]|nr:DMT family transporter [Bacillota bacterium]
MNQYKFSLSILLAAFLWSTSYAVSKSALISFDPSTLAFLRFAVSLFLLGCIIKLWRIGFSLPDQSLYKLLALSGLLGYTFYFMLQNWGLKFAYATDATLLVASYPVITAFIESMVTKKSIPPKNWLGIFLAVSGVTLIIQPWNVGSIITVDRFIGIILFLLTGVVWAIYNIVINRIGEMNIFQLTFWQAVFGALFIFPFVIYEAPALKEVPMVAWGSLGYLAIFCSLIAFLFYNYGLRAVPPNQAVNILNSVPVFGALIGYFFLGEILTMLQAIGGIVVIIGVYISFSAKSNSKDIEIIRMDAK